MTARILRHLGDLELAIGIPELALSPLEESIRCLSKPEWLPGRHGRAVYGGHCSPATVPPRRYAETATAAAALRPGIDQGYLVAYARAEVLRARGDHEAADRYLEARRMLIEDARRTRPPRPRRRWSPTSPPTPASWC